MKRDESLIPRGMYCYIVKPISGNIESIEIKTCPYWELRTDKPYQQNGYCHFLKSGDWEEDGTIFLFDQVKECGINTEERE